MFTCSHYHFTLLLNHFLINDNLQRSNNGVSLGQQKRYDIATYDEIRHNRVLGKVSKSFCTYAAESLEWTVCWTEEISRNIARLAMCFPIILTPKYTQDTIGRKLKL